MVRSARAASGASASRSRPPAISSSINRWTSSSRTASAKPTTSVAACPAVVSALAGTASQSAVLVTWPPDRMRSVIVSELRKFSCTKPPRAAPNWSLRSTITAVCGMGNPSGWRKMATTANQSARPPTREPSTAARTYANAPRSLPTRVTTMNTANIATSSPVAWRFLARSWRRRSPSSRPGGAADHERATLSPDGADDCEARRPVRVSSALIEPVLIVGARDASRDRPPVGGPPVGQKWSSPPHVPRPRSSSRAAAALGWLSWWAR